MDFELWVSKILKFFIFHLKLTFIDRHFFISNWVYSDRYELDISDGIIRFQIFNSVGSYDEKTAENDQICTLQKSP